MDVAHELARYVLTSSYENIPQEVTKTTKKFILDTIGTTMAGSSDPCCRAVIKLVQEWGGKEESSILVFGSRVPSVHAAFANSMMAHALDFDDNYAYDLETRRKNGGHANVSVLPAALAAAELSRKTSGKELIAAVALGVDVMLRLTFAARGGRGWTRSAICGVFGAATAAGYLLNLDEDEMVNAFGIAYSQASGNQQAIIDKALVKRMQPAFAAKSGVFSALLAQRGVTGAKDIFEGKFGFFKMYSGGDYDLTQLLGNLGTRYEGLNLGIKPYPCGRLIHPAIDGALEIVIKYDIKPEEIKEVLVYVPERTFDLVGAPFAAEDDFRVRVQFSIPYGLSVAIVRREVCMEDFLDEGRIKDYRLVEIARKVKVVVDEESEYAAKLPVTVEIDTVNKGKFAKKVERMRGDPRFPLSEQEFRKKIISCAKYASRPELLHNIEQIIERVNNLEEIDSITGLVSLIAPPVNG